MKLMRVPPRMRATLSIGLRFACLTSLAVWWGGLTWYALVVVPIGSELLGAMAQGMITQRVTNWLNILGVITLALLLWEESAQCRRTQLGAWAVQAVILIALIGLHRRLDDLLDEAAGSTVDAEVFYAWHRGYLLLTTMQWACGLIQLWGTVFRRSVPTGRRI